MRLKKMLSLLLIQRQTKAFCLLQKAEKTPMMDKAEKIEKEIRVLSTKFNGLKTVNRNLSLGLGVSGILISLFATIFGILESPKAAAISAASAASLQSILLAFPVDKRAHFFNSILAKSKNLELDLMFKGASPEILTELKDLNVMAGNEEPRGDLSTALSLEKINEYIDSLNELVEKIKEANPEGEANPEDEANAEK